MDCSYLVHNFTQWHAIVKTVTDLHVSPFFQAQRLAYFSPAFNLPRHCILSTLCKLLLYLFLISFTNFNAQLFYSLTICMLHYNPWHVSSINMPIFRGQFVLSQHLVSSLSLNGCTVCRMRADCSAVYSHPALKMGMLMLETRRGL